MNILLNSFTSSDICYLWFLSFSVLPKTNNSNKRDPFTVKRMNKVNCFMLYAKRHSGLKTCRSFFEISKVKLEETSALYFNKFKYNCFRVNVFLEKF